ncbi:MAG: hypothetical protein ACRDRA_13245 [Pseudonocardiaceae bacterium]
MCAALNLSEFDDQNAELLPARTLLSVFSQDVAGSVGGATGSASKGTVFGTLGNASSQVFTGGGVGNVGDFFGAFFSGRK